jgi:cell division protein FtsW
MLLITAFQFISALQVIVGSDGSINKNVAMIFAAYLAVEWIYSIISSIVFKKSPLGLESIAFFLTGIDLVIVAAANPDLLLKQFISVIIGLLCFIILLWMIANVDRAMSFRMPMAIASLVLLVITLAFAGYKNGAYNWLIIGPVSIQSSELVKIAFIYVGAASLETIQSTKSLTKYVIYAVACIGMLFAMRDLGTALIFFFTFLVLAFMRSGDIRTIVLAVLGAGMAAAMVVIFRSNYVLNRFKTYRHIWEYADAGGFQQTRVLTYSASGGLLGLGIGNGKCQDLFAATEDLVFGVICEEWGIIMGFIVFISFALIFVHSVKNAKGASSAFYSIASTAAGALILFQAALNVFGVTDFLPMTGVTLPFVSRGGSSAISCWALLAFIKAADNRTWAVD